MVLHQVHAQGQCRGSKTASTMVYVEAWEKGNIGNRLDKNSIKPFNFNELVDFQKGNNLVIYRLGHYLFSE